MTLDGNNALRSPRDGQCEIAGAGEKLEHAVALLEISGQEQLVENALISRRIYLREDIGVDHEVEIAAQADRDSRLAPSSAPIAAGNDHAVNSFHANEICPGGLVARYEVACCFGHYHRLIRFVAGDDLKMFDVCVRTARPTAQSLDDAVQSLPGDEAGVNFY